MKSVRIHRTTDRFCLAAGKPGTTVSEIVPKMGYQRADLLAREEKIWGA